MLQRLDTEKAPEVGLRAWAASGLAGRGWRLVVAGSGALRPGLEAECATFGPPCGVTFAGNVDDTDGLLAGASILLAPAPAEPFGLSVVEAMSHGLAVVAAAGGAHLETVGDAGVLFAPGDVTAAATALAGLADDRAAPPCRRRSAATAPAGPILARPPPRPARGALRRGHRSAAGRSGPRDPLVEGLLELGHPGPRVAVGRVQHRRHGAVPTDPARRAGARAGAQGGRAVGGHQESGVPDHLGQGAAGAGHGGDTGGLALDHDAPELLQPPRHGHRRHGEHVEGPVDVGKGGLLDVAVERHPIGDPEPDGALPECRRFGSGAVDLDVEPVVARAASTSTATPLCGIRRPTKPTRRRPRAAGGPRAGTGRRRPRGGGARSPGRPLRRRISPASALHV